MAVLNVSNEYKRFNENTVVFDRLNRFIYLMHVVKTEDREGVIWNLWLCYDAETKMQLEHWLPGE